MYHSIEGDELFKKYIDIWNKVSNSQQFKKNFIVNPSPRKHFWKQKSYADEATDFHAKEMSKVSSNYTGLAVILIDFVLKKYGNYYSHVLLKKVPSYWWLLF